MPSPLAMHEAFLADIRAAPDDDFPRMIYADWLEDNGGDEAERARGRFIRLQCQAEKLPENSAERNDLTRQAAALEKKHARAWLGLLAEIRGTDSQTPFRRGLPLHLFVTPGKFVNRKVQATLRQSMVRAGVLRLVLYGSTKRPGLVLASDALNVLSSLDWTDAKLQNDGMQLLARCPHLGGLRALEISKPGCNNQGLAFLAASQGLAAVEEFTLAGCIWGGPQAFHLDDGGFVKLLESDAMPRLWHLGMSGGRWGARSGQPLTRLLQCRALERITSLDLSENYLADEWARKLAECQRLRNLRKLHLAVHQITDVGVLALLDSPHLQNLDYLGLWDAVITFRPATVERLQARFKLGKTANTWYRETAAQ
jgi:uncharacterized protein (TIGR02996 family)